MVSKDQNNVLSSSQYSFWQLVYEQNLERTVMQVYCMSNFLINEIAPCSSFTVVFATFRNGIDARFPWFLTFIVPFCSCMQRLTEYFILKKVTNSQY
jgi:hypothetical protein